VLFKTSKLKRYLLGIFLLNTNFNRSGALMAMLRLPFQKRTLESFTAETVISFSIHIIPATKKKNTISVTGLGRIAWR
jgi:hypothetical protein